MAGLLVAYEIIEGCLGPRARGPCGLGAAARGLLARSRRGPGESTLTLLLNHELDPVRGAAGGQGCRATSPAHRIKIELIILGCQHTQVCLLAR